MKKPALAALFACSLVMAQDAGPWSAGVGYAHARGGMTPYGSGMVVDLGLTAGLDRYVQFRFLAEGFTLQPNDVLIDNTNVRFDAHIHGFSGFAEAVFNLSEPRRPGPYLTLGAGWSHFWVSDKNGQQSAPPTFQLVGVIDHSEQGNGLAATLGLGWRLGRGWALELRNEWQTGTIRAGSAAPAGGYFYLTSSANIAPDFTVLELRKRF